jgi:hypothetical protein
MVVVMVMMVVMMVMIMVVVKVVGVMVMVAVVVVAMVVMVGNFQTFWFHGLVVGTGVKIKGIRVGVEGKSWSCDIYIYIYI